MDEYADELGIMAFQSLLRIKIYCNCGLMRALQYIHHSTQKREPCNKIPIAVSPK